MLEHGMKVVCVCRCGQVRSVAARYVLSDKFGFRKALACGWEKNDAETLDMLYSWADAVLVVGRGSEWGLPTPPDKTVLLEVGEDVWGHYQHPDLVSRLEELLAPLVLGSGDHHYQQTAVRRVRQAAAQARRPGDRS